MGFRAARREFRLTFPPGHPLHGLEMQAHSVALGEVLELNRAYRQVKGATDPEVKLGAVGKLMDVFATALQSWNLEDDDGHPVTADRAGLDHLDPVHLFAAVEAWVRSVGAVDGPLGQRSIPTPNSATPAPAIPMASMATAPES